MAKVKERIKLEKQPLVKKSLRFAKEGKIGALYMIIYIYTSSSMVPLGYAYRLLRGGILGGSRGGKSTSEGRGVLWV